MAAMCPTCQIFGKLDTIWVDETVMTCRRRPGAWVPVCRVDSAWPDPTMSMTSGLYHMSQGASRVVSTDAIYHPDGSYYPVFAFGLDLLPLVFCPGFHDSAVMAPAGRGQH
ncbi:hypothetical protein Bbelb_414080 [Branchiostoma belcheri]|nr:hypothetical protein Bbelb_414080 [Branchiostoma belcheri]